MKKWAKCRDVIGGEEEVKKARTKYLPKPSGMEDEEYDGYLERAEFFNATGRTVEGLHGMMFRKNPIIEVPDNLKDILDNVDGKGNSFVQFISDTAWDCLQTGFGGVLIDAPQTEGKIESRNEEEQAGIAPYMTYYKAEQIINWRYRTVGRRQELYLVVLEEEYEKDASDKYDKRLTKRYRVLELDKDGEYVQSLYNEDTQIVGEPIKPKKGGKAMNHIPFFLLPAKEPEKPMMLDLVNVNLAWYRKSADLENGAHWTGVPTPYVLGYEPEKKYDEEGNEIPAKPIKLGSTAMLVFPQGVTHVGYLELSGNFNALQSMLAIDEDRMAILGARIISAERKGVESAETAKIHRAGENSVLATCANNLSIVFTEVLQTYLQWTAHSDNEIECSVNVNTDYDVATMSPAELTALVSLWQSGGIPKSILYDNLREGEIIKGDRTFEDVQAEIQEEQAMSMQQSIQSMQAQNEMDMQAMQVQNQLDIQKAEAEAKAKAQYSK